MKIVFLFIGLLFCLSVYGGDKKYSDRSPASVIKAAKAKKQAKKEHRQKYLVLSLVRSTRTRYHAISALIKSMPDNVKNSFRSLASSNRVDLRKPLNMTVFENRDFKLGNRKDRFVWKASEKAYYYQGKKLFFDKRLSAKQNFEKLKSVFSKKASLIDFFIHKAHAQDLNEVIFDLNYILYVGSVDDEQQLINELGSDYIMRAEDKMVRLAQKNRFLSMECSMGAHSMEARIILGDGSAENRTELVAQDLGQGKINLAVIENGVWNDQPNIAESAAPLLSQNIFNEVCMNMSSVEVQQTSEGIWYYGNGSAVEH